MSGLEQVRAFLPWWVVWGPLLLLIPSLFLLSLVSGWLTATVTGWPRKTAEMSPVERSRRAYPVRRALRFVGVMLAVANCVILKLLGLPLCPCPSGVLILLAALAGYVGVALVVYRVEQDLQQGRHTLGAALRRELVIWLLLASSVPILLVLFTFMPDELDLRVWLLLGGGFVVLGFFIIGPGDFLLAWLLGLIQPAPPRLQVIAERTAQGMGIRLRGAHVILMPGLNALAFPFLGRMAWTPRALEVLDDDEVQAVCAHEIGHLGESWLMLCGRVWGLVLIPPLAAASPLARALGIEWVLGLLVLFILVGLFTQRLSRRLERRADRLAVIQQSESGTYARALEKIYLGNLEPVVGEGQGLTHPHLYDRLVAAGAPPDYPRPRPPARLRRWLAVSLSLALVVSFWVGFFALSGEASQTDKENSLFWATVLRGGDARTLAALAHLQWHKGQYRQAGSLYGAAAELEPGEAHYLANRAIVLAALNRCDEAEEAAQEAEGRLPTSQLPGSAQVVRQARIAVRNCKQRRID